MSNEQCPEVSQQLQEYSRIQGKGELTQSIRRGLDQLRNLLERLERCQDFVERSPWLCPESDVSAVKDPSGSTELPGSCRKPDKRELRLCILIAKNRLGYEVVNLERSLELLEQ
jgi:hypothetical protein